MRVHTSVSVFEFVFVFVFAFVFVFVFVFVDIWYISCLLMRVHTAPLLVFVLKLKFIKSKFIKYNL